MPSEKIKFIAKKSAFDRAIRTASRFTAARENDPFYLRCIDLDVREDGTIKFTAQNSTSDGIEFVRDGFDVTTAGHALVPAASLITILSVIGNDKDVIVTSDGVSLTVTDAANSDTTASVDIPVSDEGDLKVPSLPASNDTDAAIVSSEQFVTAYQVVAEARATDMRYPIVRGIFVQQTDDPDGDGSVLRLLASNGIGSTSHNAKVGKTVGDGFPVFVLNHESVALALEYVGSGSQVRLSATEQNEQNRIHLDVVSDDDDDPLYHIVVSPLDFDPKKFPTANIERTLAAMLASGGSAATVDKADLMRVLGAAATVGSLDQQASGGQSRKINVTISESGITAKTNGRGKFKETIDLLKPWNGSDDVRFDFSYGLFSQMLAVSDIADNKTMRVCIFNGEDGSPVCLMVFDASEGKEDVSIDSLPGFFSLIGIENGEYV